MSILQNRKLKSILKIILPLIFIHYFITISFYTHSHVVNGVTIVHSHPYQSDKDGKPLHEHSSAEIQLIHTLSVFYAVAIVVIALLLALFATRCRKIEIPVRAAILKSHEHLHQFLRPPPQVVNI